MDLLAGRVAGLSTALRVAPGDWWTRTVVVEDVVDPPWKGSSTLLADDGQVVPSSRRYGRINS